jgi:hypothetical protein
MVDFSFRSFLAKPLASTNNGITWMRPSKSKTNGLSPKLVSMTSPGVWRPTVG